MQLLPNLIIAGAPKCGSTSLFSYLADHPQVCAAVEQETRYLIDKGYPLFNDKMNYFQHGLPGYNAFFPHYDASQHSVLLECTPDYLYQELALDVIPKLPSKPNIVFILRKPSARIYSLYRFAQNNIGKLGKQVSFTQFVEDVHAGRIAKERQILANAMDHSHYAKYLQRWLEAVGPERIVIQMFEQLVRNPAQSMVPLAEKLGIDADFYRDYSFAQQNQTINVKRPGVFSAVKTGLRWFPGLKNVKTLYTPLKRWYHSSVIDFAKIPVSDEDKRVMKQIDEEFRGQNAELSQMMGLDLGCWEG